jgi:uncharacterized DUF497 family protein
MHNDRVDIEFDPTKAKARLVTLGADSLGRKLVVVHTSRGEPTRLIAAGQASIGESEHYDA